MLYYKQVNKKRVKIMEIWLCWWNILVLLRPAFPRTRTFLWFAVCVAGMSVREDLLGVSSIVRSVGLDGLFYDRLLDMFHCGGLNPDRLASLWAKTVLSLHPGIERLNGRPVLIGDGIKTAKSGVKMPSVRKLFQSSGSNTKKPYINGHSCQCISVLAGIGSSIFAIPLICRIHEGLVFSNRDNRTLLDKMSLLLDVLGIQGGFYLVADAYYASGRFAMKIIRSGGHLITRVRSNAVAYLPPEGKRKGRGRRKTYGKKVKLAHYLSGLAMKKAESPVYGESAVTISFSSADLMWRPAGVLVRFVLVVHPLRGTIMLMSTDITLSPIEPKIPVF